MGQETGAETISNEGFYLLILREMSDSVLSYTCVFPSSSLRGHRLDARQLLPHVNQPTSQNDQMTRQTQLSGGEIKSFLTKPFNSIVMDLCTRVY